MSDLIAGFVRALRRRGIEVSPAEHLDASRAARLVGPEARDPFRLALRASLAKTPEDTRAFDEVFDAHFAPPRGRGGARGDQDDPAGAGSGSGGGAGPGGKPRQAGPERPPERLGAPATSRHVPRTPAPGRTGDEARRAGERRPSDVPRRAPRVIPSEGRREEGGRAAAGERPHGVRRGTAAPPRRRDLVLPLTLEEEASLAREVAEIVRQIRLRRGRRFAEGRRGRLWIKRLIRRSLAHGGVPFTLPMKEARPRTPRVVLLVDVSWSVARAAGLFLLVCAGLADRLRRVEVFFFVDRVVEATELVRSWAARRAAPPVRGGAPPAAAPSRRRRAGAGIAPRPGAPPFASLIEGIPDLDPSAASDYGRAFYHARGILPRSGGRDTVLVVLGDARSNYRDPLPWAFEEAAGRCRRVIWLNPEPRALWDTADSVMSAYMEACDVICEARDLEGIARGVREILRAA